MKEDQITLPGLIIKTIAAHTVTYFTIGLLALVIFNYSEALAQPEIRTWMRQTSDPIVALGPGLQPIRGILFALAFYPLREILFRKKYGWLITWWLLISLGILSTFGPAPSSVEGLIYMSVPASEQITGGTLEILTQAFLFSTLLYYWVNHPEERWINWLMGILLVLVIFMSLMGFLLAAGYVAVPA